MESSYKINPSSFLPIKSSIKCIDQSKQPCHTMEAVKLMEHEFKTVLGGLVQHLFGKNIEYRWVDSYFPFTQPSWECEIYYGDQWLEVLGSGIMRNEILETNGVHNTIGWAFGVGLERLAMILYDIPDIRLFWSTDTGFLSQFDEKDFGKGLKYKPVSTYPQCVNDLSFWLADGISLDQFSANDFYDLVREVAGDIAEQVTSLLYVIRVKNLMTFIVFGARSFSGNINRSVYASENETCQFVLSYCLSAHGKNPDTE